MPLLAARRSALGIVLDEFSVYKQNMEKYLTELAGIYESYVTQTESLFTQYESQFNECVSIFVTPLPT